MILVGFICHEIGLFLAFSETETTVECGDTKSLQLLTTLFNKCFGQLIGLSSGSDDVKGKVK